MNDTAELILHGVGTSQLVFKDGSILPIAQSKDIQIKVDATTAEQKGGDGFYALLEFVTEKTGTVTITNATMSLADLKAVTGDDITSKAEKWIQNENQTISAGAAQLAYTSGVVVDSVIARLKDGTVIKRVEASAATLNANEFTVTSAGVIKTNTALNSKVVIFDYYVEDILGLAIHSLEDSVPSNCELRHRIITDEMADGKRYELNIRVYNCKAKGSYDYTAKRGEAFSPKLDFSILDAGRADRRTLTYSINEYTA